MSIQISKRLAVRAMGPGLPGGGGGGGDKLVKAVLLETREEVHDFILFACDVLDPQVEVVL